jgi:hypothetical protein
MNRGFVSSSGGSPELALELVRSESLIEAPPLLDVVLLHTPPVGFALGGIHGSDSLRRY